MALVRVSDSTKEMLMKYAADLQGKLGRRVTLDEAIQSLLNRERTKDPALLARACVNAGGDGALIELYEERRRLYLTQASWSNLCSQPNMAYT